MFCFLAENDLFRHVTANPSLNEGGVEVTYVRVSILQHQCPYESSSWMTQKSKNNLLLSTKDFSPHIHTSVMMPTLPHPPPPNPMERIWIIWLPPKLCNVHSEDDIKSEEYSKHTEKSPAY